jgi:hypothetical protein
MTRRPGNPEEETRPTDRGGASRFGYLMENVAIRSSPVNTR